MIAVSCQKQYPELREFETADWVKAWGLSRVQHVDRLKLQTRYVKQGKSALSVSVAPGDIAQIGKDGKKTERTEIKDKKELLLQEEEWFGFSVYLPKDFNREDVRTVIAQWKQHCEDNCHEKIKPVIALRLKNGRLMITISTDNGKNQLYQTPRHLIIEERWLEFVFRVKFSKFSDGRLSAWLNRKRVVNYQGKLGYSKGGGTGYFKMGVYRDALDFPSEVFFDSYQRSEKNLL